LAQDEPPSAEQVAEFCKRLEAALAPEVELKSALTTLKEARRVEHDDVVKLLDTRGLHHANPTIRSGALEALARIDLASALDALHAEAKRDKKELAVDPPRHVALLRAIARHGEVRSIPFLVEDLF
jgi:hypothetical protein